MAKKIVFSRKSYNDIDRIVEFNNLRNQSDTYSKKFIINLHKRLSLLERYPMNGIKTDQEDILLLIWDDYYIFYSNNKDALVIKSIYHQKEDVQF